MSVTMEDVIQCLKCCGCSFNNPFEPRMYGCGAQNEHECLEVQREANYNIGVTDEMSKDEIFLEHAKVANSIIGE